MTLIRLPNVKRKLQLNDKRLQLIQKAQTPLAIKLQIINNMAVDEKIFELTGEYESMQGTTVPYYDPQNLHNMIYSLNYLATRKDFDRLLRNSIVSNEHIMEMEKINSSKKIGRSLTKIEVERIGKNLEYVEKSLKEAELDITRYKELVNKVPRHISRMDLLEKAYSDGYNYKGKEYSYREMKSLHKSIVKYQSSYEDFEKAKMLNEQSQRDGYGVLKQKKIWYYDPNERTRHSNMDGQERGLYEYFEVVNDKTGDTDMMRFPHDVENDNNNCSNICNCRCGYKISEV